ncbi:MAG: universal stress protein, partial [Acidimicrobiales bacterium]
FRRSAVDDIEKSIEAVGPARYLPPIICRAKAGPALVGAGAAARLIVVGTRGRSGLEDAMLGSVSSHVVANATTPVAVIPADAAFDDVNRRLTVGVDGSVNSMRALAWAIKHAPRSAVIEVVHCWLYPAGDMPGLAVIPEHIYQDRATFVLDGAIAAAKRAVGTHGHRIVRRVENGDPRTILVDRGGSSDMLVLGAKGRGGVGHLLLGSVATALLHQPRIPTVVVPAKPGQTS